MDQAGAQSSQSPMAAEGGAVILEYSDKFASQSARSPTLVTLSNPQPKFAADRWGGKHSPAPRVIAGLRGGGYAGHGWIDMTRKSI